MLDKQGSMSLNVDPVFTAADVNAKNKELTNICSPTVHKPKPKPKEVPKEEPKAAEPAPMETDEKKDAMETETAEGEKKEESKMEVDEA